MLHEIQSYDEASFITLTYAEDKLPLRGSDDRGILVKADLQNFFKRLRKVLNGKKIKYYACGEYGDDKPRAGVKGSRPHYHAILFGLSPTEEFLSDVWGMGLVDVATAEIGSIRYVAGYVSKKLGLHEYPMSGRPAPFQLSSQGIGTQWAQENMIEILSSGCLTFQGRKLPVPRAYVDKLDEIFPEAVEGFSIRRTANADLALTDIILEMAPEYGGKNWSQLSAEERENLIIQLQKRGELIDADLRSKERMREYKL